jgi:hypothetical protein
VRIQVRGGTTAQWNAADAAGRVLALREFGYDETTDTLKIGDGVTDFASLPEIGGGAAFDGTLTGVGLTLATGGETISIKSGADACAGTGVLAAGAASVATNALTDNSLIFLTTQVRAGTPGFLTVNGRVSGAGFDVASSSGTDTSTFAWWIVELG